MGQLRSVHWHWEVGQNKGECSNMVFVSVGDEDGPHPRGTLPQIGDVGDNQVYPQHILFRELDPAVDDDDVVAALQGHHVLADFPQSAQGDHS